MQNVEFKAELLDLDLARLVCRQIRAHHIAVVKQRDTYFRVPDGRLKRRETEGEPVEYIFYHRPNRPRARISHFTIYTEGQARERWGAIGLPVWVTVEKTREIWMHSSVRLHIDQVDRLGRFFEAEALVTPSNHLGKCHESVLLVRQAFSPALGEPISDSYCDLMARELEAAGA